MDRLWVGGETAENKKASRPSLVRVSESKLTKTKSFQTIQEFRIGIKRCPYMRP